MSADMSFSRICSILGNGNVSAGIALAGKLAERLTFARTKHPVFAEGVYQGLGRITGEYEELVHAVEHETCDRQFDEVLDVIVTAIRFANREYAP